MSTRWFGAAVLRRDDERLLKGEGRYLDDIALAGMAHVAFVRSPYASALIKSVDATAALQQEGVVQVITHADLGAAAQPFPQLLPHRGLVSATWCALAGGRARFAGEAVAA